MITTILSLALSANAASLDLLEVGGLYGTPAATNATATFWNPAGLAMEQGTRFNLEGAPAFANVDINVDGAGEYWGGEDKYTYFGVAPFAGVATDFGVDGLGVGLSLSVPFAKGAEAVEYGGNGRYHLQKADIKSLYFTGAAAYRIKNVSFGAAASLIRSSWGAISTTQTLSSLNENLQASGLTTEYSDDDIYNPRYTTTLDFNNLADTTYTFSAGLYYTPVEKIGFSASYLHGGRFDHTGDLGLSFSCPPEEDVFGRLGANLTGICYAELSGQGSVGYQFPWRTNFGVRWMPTGEPDRFAIELMGAYVNWSDFTDYEISTVVDPDTVELDDETARQSTADTVSQNRLWARDNTNTFWVGVDVKRRVADDKLLLGGRVIYDRAAIPDTALAANNIDANTIILGALGAYRITNGLDLGVSYGHYFLPQRETSTSAFSTTLDAANAAEDRYFYPSSNGSYKVAISRLAVNLTGHFGQSKRPSSPEIEEAATLREEVPSEEATTGENTQASESTEDVTPADEVAAPEENEASQEEATEPASEEVEAEETATPAPADAPDSILEASAEEEPAAEDEAPQAEDEW